MKTFIYGLIDSNDTIFYIGKSNDVKKRFRMHVTKTMITKRSKLYNNFRKHIPFTYKIIECVDINQWEQKEKYYINLYSKKYNLYNISIGGIIDFNNFEKLDSSITHDYIDIKSISDEHLKQMGLSDFYIQKYKNNNEKKIIKKLLKDIILPQKMYNFLS